MKYTLLLPWLLVTVVDGLLLTLGLPLLGRAELACLLLAPPASNFLRSSETDNFAGSPIQHSKSRLFIFYWILKVLIYFLIFENTPYV